MGARLYNSETGRFMSVDPLIEIFTGHSPYHYSYNNTVMFRDPSGLAPEGEKNNTVQAEGADNISSGYTCGYWTTKVTFSYKNYFTKNLDDPLAPRGRTFHSDETITIENTFIPSSRAGGGGGVSISMPESNGGFNGSRNSSRKTHNNTTNKSMRDQNYVEKHYNNTVYANKGGIDEIEKNFNVTLTFKNAGIHDLYEITSVTPNNYVMNNFFILRLQQLLNNGIQPVALSDNQSMNKNKIHKNVRTIKNSVYGIETAFIAEIDDEYFDLDLNPVKFTIGQNIAHEFFGHIYHTIFGDHYPWYLSWMVTEMPAMEIENLYLFFNGLPQRNHYNTNVKHGTIGEWLLLKSYP
jgi:hypothetical protein